MDHQLYGGDMPNLGSWASDWATYGSAGKDFKDFNANNISNEQLNALRNDVYGGYKTKDVARYEMRGAGDGRSSRQTGYKSVNNYDYYDQHIGWSGIAKEVGINRINSENDIRQMYDFVNGYSGPSNSGSSQQRVAPTSQGSSSIDFSKQLAAIKAQNQASINALTKQMTDQKADYDARELAANKKISSLSSTVANAQSQYDPTKGMGSSNNINPALTIQEKQKSLSSGTQRYNRGQLSINNLNV
jgi:hypothetical protein